MLNVGGSCNTAMTEWKENLAPTSFVSHHHHHHHRIHLNWEFTLLKIYICADDWHTVIKVYHHIGDDQCSKTFNAHVSSILNTNWNVVNMQIFLQRLSIKWIEMWKSDWEIIFSFRLRFDSKPCHSCWSEQRCHRCHPLHTPQPTNLASI